MFSCFFYLQFLLTSIQPATRIYINFAAYFFIKFFWIYIYIFRIIIVSSSPGENLSFIDSFTSFFTQLTIYCSSHFLYDLSLNIIRSPSLSKSSLINLTYSTILSTKHCTCIFAVSKHGTGLTSSFNKSGNSVHPNIIASMPFSFFIRSIIF